MPRLPNPFRRAARPLATGAPGHPLPAAPRRPPRPAPPGPAIQGVPGIPLGSAGSLAGRTAGDERSADPAWELVAAAVVLVAVVRLANGPAFWAAALLTGVAVGLAALEVLGGTDDLAGVTDRGVPLEALLVPATMGFAGAAAFHAIPAGLTLAAGLVVAGALALASISIERRLLARPSGPDPADRTLLLGLVVVLGFLGFTGVAAAIPGALAQPAPIGTELPVPGLPLDGLVQLAAFDALVAGLLGYRLASLRTTSARDALLAALSYAAVIAIGAAALRAMALPRLLGPALLTLVLYLWSAYRGVPRTARQDVRWLWEIVLLALVGVLVVAWNLVAQG